MARPDRSEAHRIAKEVLGRLLADYWSLGERVPSAKSALLRAQRLSASDFAATIEGLRAGKSAAEMLDDRFLAAFTIAGTAEDCLAQARAYLEAGATELVLSFAGPEPERDMQYLGWCFSSVGRRVGKIATQALPHASPSMAILPTRLKARRSAWARRAQRVCRADFGMERAPLPTLPGASLVRREM